jgi:hypothetical protein
LFDTKILKESVKDFVYSCESGAAGPGTKNNDLGTFKQMLAARDELVKLRVAGEDIAFEATRYAHKAKGLTTVEDIATALDVPIKQYQAAKEYRLSKELVEAMKSLNRALRRL